MSRYASTPTWRVDPRRPTRLDGRPYWSHGRLAAALTDFREANGFTSWIFCTRLQAERHGCHIARHWRRTCLVHQFDEGGPVRFFYSEDQFE